MSTHQKPPKEMDMGALGLEGKEAEDHGKLEGADTAIEAALEERYRTVNSPVHVAVWDGVQEPALWNPPPLE